MLRPARRDSGPVDRNGETSLRPPRLRRATSTGVVEDASRREKRDRSRQPDEPVHKNCDSLLSWRAEFTDYNGIVNWGFTLLFLGGARLCLENIRKYGLLVDPPMWFSALNGGPFSRYDRYPSLLTLFYLQVHGWIALFIEKLLSRGRLSFRLGMSLHALNVVMVLLVPHVVAIYIATIPLIGMTVISFSCVVLALKLTSYAHVNKWCREENSGRKRHRSFSHSKYMDSMKCGIEEEDVCEPPVQMTAGSKLVLYPDNLNSCDMFYYLLVPTLCYEINFPRSDRIRVWFVSRRIFELVVGCNVLFALFQQWIIPSVQNSLEPFSKMHLTHAVERLLKLSIPNHLLWIMMFYLTFHSFFNLIAELLHFGDRSFYQDWWNANDISTFWRTWNVPVHRFAMRHLYLPLIRHRFSRFTASLAVFLLSAFLHEYLVGIPLRLLRVWAFTAMMGQIPLARLTEFVGQRVSSRLSNVIVWLSLIIGQPLAIMVYYHDYIIEYRGDLTA